MKKSSFIAMILGVISLGFFALGMCMALLPEWNALQPGIICGCIGLVLGVVTLLVWRRMEHKAPIHIKGKIIAYIVVGVIGALLLGTGMCLTMVWSNIVVGIVVGIVGISILLCLIPLMKGIK